MVYIYIYIYIYTPTKDDTTVSTKLQHHPWLVDDEDRVLHVFSYVV